MSLCRAYAGQRPICMHGQHQKPDGLQTTDQTALSSITVARVRKVLDSQIANDFVLWARLLWSSFCDRMQALNMPLDRSRQFLSAAVVIEMACCELGIKPGLVGFQIHIDDAEVSSKAQKFMACGTVQSPPAIGLHLRRRHLASVSYLLSLRRSVHSLVKPPDSSLTAESKPNRGYPAITIQLLLETSWRGSLGFLSRSRNQRLAPYYSFMFLSCNQLLHLPKFCLWMSNAFCLADAWTAW